MAGWVAGWVAGPTVIIRLSQFNLTKFDWQLELSLATFETSPKVANLNVLDLSWEHAIST